MLLRATELKCKSKMILGRNYTLEADKMKLRHGKEYGVYICRHCNCRHLTTKLDDAYQKDRSDFLYRTDK